MLREERDRALKVGVKQPHKKSSFNEGQNVPDSIVSALSSSPGILYSNYSVLVTLQDPGSQTQAAYESADHPFELLLP